MEFYIGADPEMFLADASGNLKSGIGIIKGTKYDQMMVDGGGLQYDNVAVEFSCDPQDSEESFVEVIAKMLKHLSVEVAPLKLLALASTNFPEAELDNEEARRFGCDPDFDAWALCMNQVSSCAVDAPFRSCGGHIHIGTKNGSPKVLAEDSTGMGKVEMVKAMDFFVGISSILLDRDPSAGPRRALYGKAGAHRPKDYGVEYRAVGNFWLRTPDLVRMVYRLTALAVAAADSGTHTKYIDEVGQGTVCDIINESKVDEAQAVFDKYIKPHMKEETLALFEKCANQPFSPELQEPWSL